MTRALLLLGALAALWAGAVAAAGGFDVRIGGLSLRSHNPIPAAVVAVLCLALAFRRGLVPARDALWWWWTAIERRAGLFAALVAAAAVATGIAWGTDVAGGPDSYCYINQAEILARGSVRELQPIVARAPWPDRAAAFVPIGHVPAPAPEGAIVPMCAAGYPLMMAGARLAGGRTAMFWVVPLLGGLAVWATFALGRVVAGPVVGLLAAVLLAGSPAFLYQIVQPMTDVPAVALWTLALLAVTSAAERGVMPALPAGIATGAAILVRPNLVPLAAVIGLMSIADGPPRRDWLRRGALFAAGVLPFAIAVALLQDAMYGGPLKSGYGNLESLFAARHVLPNLARYPVWLLQTQTPFVLLALAGPFFVAAGARRRAAWWLLVFAAATFVCYLPYEIFNDWWYLRFVLPAYPPLLILASAAFVGLLRRLPVSVRIPAAAVITSALVVFQLHAAVEGNAFRLRELEKRFRDGGEYVARHLPANAAIVTVWQSGSVRFYSGRLTMLWNSIEPEWFDRSLEFLRAEGYRPYLLFEGAEEQEFRRRFAGRSALGGLEWPPMADINRQVRIYDPLDREKYQRGDPVQTHRVWTARSR